MSVYIGIDWSENKHDVVFLNDNLKVVAYLTISHTPEGFQKLDTTRQSMKIAAAEVAVGLETAHNLLIDSPMASGHAAIAKSMSCHPTSSRVAGDVIARAAPARTRAMPS